MSTIYLQAAIRSNASKVTGKYAGHFRELADWNTGAEYFIGIGILFDRLKGQCRETFAR